jgi:ADP-heptose:LPS heptosyltransferase
MSAYLHPSAFICGSIPEPAIVSNEPLRIYTGILGQIGDIVMFSATLRRLRELFPNADVTLAVSRKYREAGELVAGLPYADRLFVTELYFERLTPALYPLWELGWPMDLRGKDEVEEQRRHDIVLETRPRHRRERWWEFAHQVEELAHQVGVPGPIDLRTEIAIPSGTVIAPEAAGKIGFHNDPAISPAKAWPWEQAQQFARLVGHENLVLLGNPGPPVPGALDLRGKTALAQAAAIIAACRCYVGIDSGLIWIAGSLQLPAVGLYGTAYLPAYEQIQPLNPSAIYLQAEGSLAPIPPEAVAAAVRRAARAPPPIGADAFPPADGSSPTASCTLLPAGCRPGGGDRRSRPLHPASRATLAC